MRLLRFSLCAIPFLGVALAHHGWTGYDETKTLTLTGTVLDSGYDNPHGFVKLKSKETGDKTWTAVLAPPARMQTRGVAQEAIKKGTVVTVVGYASKSKDDELRAEKIIIDGKTIELR